MTALDSVSLDGLLDGPSSGSSEGILDEHAKKALRGAILTAVCVPGHQVPFGSREMPVARGWGSGGLQITLAITGDDDTVKVIDQGDDEGVNAVNLRRLICSTTGAEETTEVDEATVIQTRHRIPEDPIGVDQTLVLQVPVPEPLRGVERNMVELARMHAEADYARMWVSLYEDIVRNGVITKSTGYPCLVGGRYVIATTPIPRWDVPRLDHAPFLSLFGAGRERRIYAVPPYTDVEPLTFDDVPFEVEESSALCARCGAERDDGLSAAYVVELPQQDGSSEWVCSDTDWCNRQRVEKGLVPPGSFLDIGELW
ncbi:MAG: alpha-D-ribose 1-methylphosphonate 5-phosphate C-P-lyase PhnJ [Actinomycetota bacterium]